MELALGSHVREHGNRVGRLAGFELDPATRRIAHIIFSEDGTLGRESVIRPLAAIAHVHDDGEIELRTDVETGAQLPPEAVPLGRATRVKREGRDLGRLGGVEINPADRVLAAVFVRAHWWSRRTALDVSAADYSVPGEIRLSTPRQTHAA